MFLHRLAAGLVFLVGVVLSRFGVAQESWPFLAAGLLAATVGLWHFLVGGTAMQRVRGEAPKDEEAAAPQATEARSD